MPRYFHQTQNLFLQLLYAKYPHQAFLLLVYLLLVYLNLLYQDQQKFYQERLAQEHQVKEYLKKASLYQKTEVSKGQAIHLLVHNPFYKRWLIQSENNLQDQQLYNIYMNQIGVDFTPPKTLPTGRKMGLKFLGILIGFFIFVFCLTYYAFMPYPPGKIALQQLQSNQLVEVKQTNAYTFFRNRQKINIPGIILYPGIFVHRNSYASIAMLLCKMGYNVILAPSYKNTIFKNFHSQFINLIENHNITSMATDWYIGGHGEGGSVAIQQIFEIKNSSKLIQLIKGIILFAGRPSMDFIRVGAKTILPRPKNITLKDLNLCSIYFSQNRTYSELGPVSIEDERNAILQISASDQNKIQTKYGYHQFADDQFTKQTDYPFITEEIHKMISKCSQKRTDSMKKMKEESKQNIEDQQKSKQQQL